MKTILAKLNTFISLLTMLFSTAYGNENFESCSIDSSPKFEKLMSGDLVFHQKDKCYESLTCSDRIELSILLAEIKGMSPEKAMEHISSSLGDLPHDQSVRLQTALYASFLESSMGETGNSKDQIEDSVYQSKMLNAKLERYSSNVEYFYRVVNDIKEHPYRSYALYGYSEKETWQSKALNLFVDVPDFSETELGYSQNIVEESKRDLINEFEATLRLEGKSEAQIILHSKRLKKQLDRQKREMESAVYSAEKTVIGHANMAKKTYQAALSGLIIAASAGTAGPLLYALNGAGLFLAADSAGDLTESLIDAYSDGGSGDFFCSFARNNIDSYHVKNVITNAAIGGGMSLIGGGIIGTLAKSTSKVAKVAGIGIGGVFLAYGADAMYKTPKENYDEIGQHIAQAEKDGEAEIAQCLKMAQKKIIGKGVIDTAALVLSLKGIGEAQFSRSGPGGGATSVAADVIDQNIPASKLIDDATEGSTIKAKVVDDVADYPDQTDVVTEIIEINALKEPTSAGKPVQDSGQISEFIVVKSPGKSANVSSPPPSTITGSQVAPSSVKPPKTKAPWLAQGDVDGIKPIKRKSSTGDLIGSLETPRVKEVVRRLDNYFRDNPIKNKPYFSNLVVRGNIKDPKVARVLNQINTKFRDVNFITDSFKRLFAEFEYFNHHVLTNKQKPFKDKWSQFLRWLGLREGMEVVVLETRNYGRPEFTKLVGRKIIFDPAFTGRRHLVTSHGIQVLFIDRYLRSKGVPESIIKSIFKLLGELPEEGNYLLTSTDMRSATLWENMLDAFGEMDLSSPEYIGKLMQEVIRFGEDAY